MNMHRYFAVATALAALLIRAHGAASGDVSTNAATTVSYDVETARRDIQVVEASWDRGYDAYFQEALSLLDKVGQDASDPGFSHVARELMRNVTSKVCPTNIEDAYPYVQKKYRLVCRLLDIPVVHNDKAMLLFVARFVGEVRSQRIPGYVPRASRAPTVHILNRAGVRDPSGLTNDVDRIAYARALEENRRNLLMNQYQVRLRGCDMGTILVHTYRRLAALQGPDPALAAQLAEIARLTPVEQDEMAGNVKW